MTAAGTLAMRISPQSRQMFGRSQGISFWLRFALWGAGSWGLRKGHSLSKYSSTTARMAPSWMTTRNILINASLSWN